MGQQSGAGMSWIHVWPLYLHTAMNCGIVVIEIFWYNWKSKPLASSMSPLPVLLHIGSGQHPTPRLPMDGLQSMHSMGLWLPRKEGGKGLGG